MKWVISYLLICRKEQIPLELGNAIHKKGDRVRVRATEAY